MENKTKKELMMGAKKAEFNELTDKFEELDSTLSAIEKEKNTALTRQMARMKKTLLRLRECYRQGAVQAIVLTK